MFDSFRNVSAMSGRHEGYRTRSGGTCRWGGGEGVYRILRRDGYNVTIVQNPTFSLENDAAVTKRALGAPGSPAFLVGHSYGGAVIAEAGNHPRVAGLFYITAFAPDRGEFVNSFLANPPPGAPVPPIVPPQDGDLLLDRARFPASFAGDADKEEARFVADSQVLWGIQALGGAISKPAWKGNPSRYLIATEEI